MQEIILSVNRYTYWINVARCGCEYKEHSRATFQKRECKKECKQDEELKNRLQFLLDEKVPSPTFIELADKYLVTACWEEEIDSGIAEPLFVIVEASNEEEAEQKATKFWDEIGLNREGLQNKEEWKNGWDGKNNYCEVTVRPLSNVKFIF